MRNFFAQKFIVEKNPDYDIIMLNMLGGRAMNVNYESLFMMLKFAGAMLGILLVVFILALLTPVLAKKVDKLFKKDDLNAKKGNDFPDVKGIYDAQLSGENDENNGDENKDGK